MQLYRVKYLKCLRTRKYSLEHKCEWNCLWHDCSLQLSHLIWIVLIERSLHTHSEHWQHFQPVFFVLSCRTNREPSLLSSSFFLHICSWSWLFASDTHCSHGPACMSVIILTNIPSSYIWCYHSFPQRKQIQVSLIVPLLLPIRIFQHPQFKCIYTSNINQAEE